MSLSPFLPGKTSKPPGTPPPYHCHPLCSAPGTSSALQNITNEIQRPCRIGLGGLFQRCLDPCRKAFLQTDTFLVVHILVHTVNLLVVPILSFTPETFEYLPESVSVLGCSPDNSNTNGGPPSTCTLERCSIRIPLQSLLLSGSLSRALEFFSITSLNIRLSNARSAYISFSFRFSSSSSFSHLTWLTSISLYFDFPVITSSPSYPMFPCYYFCGYSAFQFFDGFHHLTLAVNTLFHFVRLRQSYRFLSNKELSGF